MVHVHHVGLFLLGTDEALVGFFNSLFITTTMSFRTDIDKETSHVLDTLNMLEKFLRETPDTVYVYNKSKHRA